jgi:hypothetical protein
MNTSTQDRGQRQADGSIFDGIPTPEEIRQEMAKNAEQNRILRSLYRVARRLPDRKRQAAERRRRVAHVE